MSKSSKTKWEDSNIVIAIIVIAIIIIYIISIGKINFTSKIDNEKQIDKTRKELKELRKIKSKKQKRYKLVYFLIRLGFVILWAIITFILYKTKLIQNLGEFLNYTQVIVLSFLIINFLTFGNITNVKAFLGIIKNSLKRRIYGKYINIDERIAEKQVKLTKLKVERVDIDSNFFFLSNKKD